MIIAHQQTETRGIYTYSSGENAPHAQLTYSRAGKHLIIIDHTKAPDTLRGTGIGRAFMEQAVEDARRLGHRIVPLCPFARSRFQRFPQWWDFLEQFTRQ